MAGCCSHSTCDASAASPRLRLALWIALIVNAAMFLVEFVAGLAVGSVALWADALDFAGDAANYALSLTVLSWGLIWRARAALLKGVAMVLFGAVVMARALWAFQHGVTPEPITMGVVGMLALLANAGVARLLYRFRSGDANMRSVWLCSRNDAIGNRRLRYRKRIAGPCRWTSEVRARAVVGACHRRSRPARHRRRTTSPSEGMRTAERRA